jgi:hypothetical protein
MRRITAFATLTLCLVACGGDERTLAFPSAPQGRLVTPLPSGPTGASAPATFDVEGCPARERRMCQEAAATAAALVQGNPPALQPLSRPTTVRCAEVDPGVYQQCGGTHGRDILHGYLVAGAEPETFVADDRHYARQLGFMRDGLDPEYSDEYGSGSYSIVGVATCDPGVRYQLVFLAGLGDPTSTLPADRFLGALELTGADRGWAISRLALDILSDWQLAFDDPLTDAGCGRIVPWGS